MGVGAWAGVLLLGRLLRIPPAAGTDVPRWVWALRAGAVLAAVGTCVLVAGFHDQGNVVKRVYERAGAGWINWSQNENYRVNGFVGGFLYNMPAAPMARPEGYSREAVLEVAGRYVDKARAINEHRDADALTDTNIVIILGESFIDPLRLEGLELGEDPIPFTRDLLDRTMSGTLRTTVFGGGTASVEFEVLTGMSTRLLSRTLPPYQALVASAERFPSLLERFNETWTTIGVHPFVADFYRRADAYRALGFDESRFIDQMRTDTRLSEAGTSPTPPPTPTCSTTCAPTRTPSWPRSSPCRTTRATPASTPTPSPSSSPPPPAIPGASRTTCAGSATQTPPWPTCSLASRPWTRRPWCSSTATTPRPA